MNFELYAGAHLRMYNSYYNNYYNIGARLWLIQFRVLGGNLIKEHLNSENYIVAL